MMNENNMNNKDIFIRSENLAVGYNRVPLIKDITFQLRKGEIMTLIGPNGAGKTTILRSLIGQLEKVGGVVYLEDKDMKDISLTELSKRLSVVLTERVRPEMMTCWDVVATGRYPYTGRFGILSEKDRRIVDDAMELVHIEELAQRDFLKTSDGQKQRVMLARAICQEPDIIVLDEPTSFLDIRYKLEFLNIIQTMSRTKNLTVIMSLHELDLAGRISDRIICVQGDHIDRFGTPEEIFSQGYIKKLYGISIGSYDERTGTPELNRVEGEPEVFVICGNGSGTETFRRLQREGIPFACGILWENDTDYASAKALASEIVSVAPFYPISEDAFEKAKKTALSCKEIICTINPESLGPLGEPVRRLIGELRDKKRL